MLSAHRTIHRTSLHHFDSTFERQRSFLSGERLAEGWLMINIQTCQLLSILVILDSCVSFNNIRAFSLDCFLKCALIILVVNRVDVQINLVNAAAL